jgi:hypothetical protein
VGVTRTESPRAERLEIFVGLEASQQGFADSLTAKSFVDPDIAEPREGCAIGDDAGKGDLSGG